MMSNTPKKAKTYSNKNSKDTFDVFRRNQMHEYYYIDKEKSFQNYLEYLSLKSNTLDNSLIEHSIGEFDYSLFNNIYKSLLTLGTDYNLYQNAPFGFTLNDNFYTVLSQSPKKLKTKYPLQYSDGVRMRAYAGKRVISSRIEIGFSTCYIEGELIPCAFLKLPISIQDKRHFYISLLKDKKYVIDIPKSSNFEEENNIYNFIYSDIEAFKIMIKDVMINVIFNKMSKTIIQEFDLKKKTFKDLPFEKIQEYTNLSTMYGM